MKSIDRPLDGRIAYYLRKVAEYGAIHPSKHRNPYRHARLLQYKAELNRRCRDYLRKEAQQ